MRRGGRFHRRCPAVSLATRLDLDADLIAKNVSVIGQSGQARRDALIHDFEARDIALVCFEPRRDRFWRRVVRRMIERRWAPSVFTEGNPLKDASIISRPAGVMVRGKWFPRAELDSELEKLARRFSARLG